MTANLLVDHEEFAHALKTIARLGKRSASAEAVISYENETITISLPGMKLRASAHGQWPGIARLPVRFLLGLSRSLPVGASVPISVDDCRMRIGNSVMPCACEEDSGSRIELPLNAPFTMILAVAYQYTPGDIAKAGLADVVADAEHRRDALIGQALAALHELGVTRAELRALVDARIRSLAKCENESDA